MKKLFLIALFAVSSFAFAHCGKCGVGEAKKCENADGSQCSSKDAHDSTHEHGKDADSNAEQTDSQAETEESSAQ